MLNILPQKKKSSKNSLNSKYCQHIRVHNDSHICVCKPLTATIYALSYFSFQTDLPVLFFANSLTTSRIYRNTCNSTPLPHTASFSVSAGSGKHEQFHGCKYLQICNYPSSLIFHACVSPPSISLLHFQISPFLCDSNTFFLFRCCLAGKGITAAIVVPIIAGLAAGVAIFCLRRR